MADFIFGPVVLRDSTINQNPQVDIKIDSKWAHYIFGNDDTYCIIKNGEDFIAALGYVSYLDGGSVSSTLTDILSSFSESEIGKLKKKLIGQYLIIIKKKEKIYFFADFLGVRNIFYSEKEQIVSSSYSRLENSIHIESTNLDIFKVMEFLALRHVQYPTWIGRGTCHKDIKWLLPYEYIVVDMENSNFRISSITFEVNNKKESDCSLLGSELLSTLKKIISRNEFKDSLVASSVTGGRDSRLIAAVASGYYSNLHFRIGVSQENYNSQRDLLVAKKLATVCKVPLDIFTYQGGEAGLERFSELVDGFAPSFNHTITPLIDSAATYSLGLGGVYGTEHFMPIKAKSISEYIDSGIERGKKALRIEDGFWDKFRETIYDEFENIKKHFILNDPDDRDYIRVFILFNTARYSSFIMSAYNNAGYQLEPYGCYQVFKLAFRVSPTLWGDHKKLCGNAWVQKSAITELNPQMASIFTYSTFRPMVPYNIKTLPIYVLGYMLQVMHWLKERTQNVNAVTDQTELPGGIYLSNGWANPFLYRTAKKYGLHIKH